jgi:hypothetical protein
MNGRGIVSAPPPRFEGSSVLDDLRANAARMSATLNPGAFLVRVSLHAGVVIRRCAWCKGVMGFGADSARGGVTDGACEDCANRYLRDFGTRGPRS